MNNKLKIAFENLGPLKKAEIELNNLTIITGENNVGKTYLTYAVYFLLQQSSTIRYKLATKYNFNQDPLMKKVLNLLMTEKKIEISFEQATKLQELLLVGYLSEFLPKMAEYFNVDAESFSKLTASLSGLITRPSRLFWGGAQIMGELLIREKKKIVYIKMYNEDNSLETVKTILVSLILSFDDDVFALTAERLGIVLFGKEMDSHRNNIVEQLQRSNKSSNKKVDLKARADFITEFTARYSSAVHDNVGYAREMFSKKKHRGLFESDTRISSKVEKVIGGTFRVINGSNNVEFYNARVKEKFNIPLHFASTSVRSMTLLYHYLKYDAKVGDTIFIDEPESHLSLNNQVELIRIIVQCINLGLKFFITTHSDFMVMELNNLIKLDSLINEHSTEDDLTLSSLKKELANKYEIKLGYTKDMAISPEKVSLYKIEKGQTVKCNVTKEGIENSTFDVAINKLNQRSDDMDFLFSLNNTEE